MSRGEFPRMSGARSSEQLAFLSSGRKLADQILADDPDLCAWVRQKFLEEKRSIREITQEFLYSSWTQQEYKTLQQEAELVRVALGTLRLELLSPEEIINLNKLKGRDQETRVIWTKELRKTLCDILAEPEAQKEVIAMNHVVKRFSEATGKPVTIGQVAMYLRRKRKLKRLTESGQQPRTDRTEAGIAGAKARGEMIWTAEQDAILQTILDESKSKRKEISHNYVRARFADLTGRAVSWNVIWLTIKRYDLLAGFEEVEISSVEEVEE